MTDPTVHFLTQLGVLLLVFGLYGIARRRAGRGSTVASRFVSAFPEGAGRLFVPFVVAAFVLWGVNVVTGGALLGPFDRFWVGLALGLTLGMLIAVLAMRPRLAQPKDRPH